MGMFRTVLDRIRNEIGMATMAVGTSEPDHVNSILMAGRATRLPARPHLADPY